MSIAEGPAYRHEMDKAPTQYNYYEDSKSYQPRHHQSHRYLSRVCRSHCRLRICNMAHYCRIPRNNCPCPHFCWYSNVGNWHSYHSYNYKIHQILRYLGTDRGKSSEYAELLRTEFAQKIQCADGPVSLRHI